MTDQPTTTNFEEAPASWNTRYTTPDGFACQITLRGQNGLEVLKRAQAAIVWLKEQNCLPSSSNGYRAESGNASQPQNDVKSPTLNDGSIDPSWCPIHEVVMKRRERDGQVWYSHKDPAGSWCKGKNGK